MSRNISFFNISSDSFLQAESSLKRCLLTSRKLRNVLAFRKERFRRVCQMISGSLPNGLAGCPKPFGRGCETVRQKGPKNAKGATVWYSVFYKVVNYCPFFGLLTIRSSFPQNQHTSCHDFSCIFNHCKNHVKPTSVCHFHLDKSAWRGHAYNIRPSCPFISFTLTMLRIRNGFLLWDRIYWCLGMSAFNSWGGAQHFGFQKT